MLYDEYQIRRKSLELGIPVLTTPELSESFVKTLEWLQTNETTKKPSTALMNIRLNHSGIDSFPIIVPSKVTIFAI